ncbi:AAA family ATPase [Nocardioides sp.]|uniref:AAA family ATPase n=1 Tax=Nocardioides sp. TaxID=35761 RepID=UPI00351473C3
MRAAGDHRLIVVSGLPASGKSTVGAALADRLGVALIDKDDILESLFDALGCEDDVQRRRLSRAADEVLVRVAARAGSAILVNWWDVDVIDRIRAIGSPMVEVRCSCPPEVAAARFARRWRHSGHLDTREGTQARADRAALFDMPPLDFGLDGGKLVVDTTSAVDVDRLIGQLGEVSG